MVAPREQILVEIETRLKAIVGGPIVYRMRTAPIDPDSLPVLVLLDGPQTPQDDETGARGYAMELSIAALVDADSDALLGPAVSDLYVKIRNAVMPAGDETLGLPSIVTFVDEGPFDGPEAGEQKGGKPWALFTLDFTVEFETSEADPGLAP